MLTTIRSNSFIIEAINPDLNSKCLVLPNVILNYSQFNSSAYSDSTSLQMDNIPNNDFITNRGATLGRVLFYDSKLSINDSVSCASCHRQELGFTDNRQFSTGFNSQEFTEAHSMRLGNSRFFEAGTYFWDRRALSLEDQVIIPIQHPVEMGFISTLGGIDSLISKLENLEYYENLFADSYGDSHITIERIQNALAQFIRSMDSNNSKWDIGYRSMYDSTLVWNGALQSFPNFSQEENEGKALFILEEEQGGAGCARCHLPPTFGLKSSSKSIGLDPDETRVFKSPSLKNVAITGPYMHDGRFANLDEVIAHYAQEIKLSPSLDPILIDENGTPERLPLNGEKRQLLITFLNTLTDYDFITNELWSDPFYWCEDECNPGKGSWLVYDNKNVIYQTKNRIPSHNKILNGSDVIFSSREIDLKEDFEVDLGSIFEIRLDPCNN